MKYHYGKEANKQILYLQTIQDTKWGDTFGSGLFTTDVSQPWIVFMIFGLDT